MNIRETIENREINILSELASKAKFSWGREKHERAEDIRTCFMIDRDRIVHSKSFRRLKDKTQVFIAPPGDHYRSRLTHTLEVSQIARTIGAGLNLNIDLIEAIALAHDVGHTPFAHAGEIILDELLANGFKHSLNSIRVLTRIEKHRDDNGLNLSKEVLDGVLYHSGFGKEKPQASTLEGQVIHLSDKIAYVQHDIDDSIRAGLLKIENIPHEYLEVLGYTHSKRIATLVTDVIKNTSQSMMKSNKKIYVSFSPQIDTALKGLRSFMFDFIYQGQVCLAERRRATFIIEHLFNYYKKHPERMSELYRQIAYQEGLETAVADYISGMSDAYCIALFEDIYVPQSLVPNASKKFFPD